MRAWSDDPDGAYRRLSLWHDTVPGRLTPRAPLAGDTDVDVAIVGAGYTGLWTAYYLASEQPDLRIAVLEKEIAGYGASGRNGGWCSALFPSSTAAVARRYGSDRARALARALRETVDEVGHVAAEERIDCHFRKGGSITLARGEAQLDRARAEVEDARRWGEEDVQLLDASAAQARVGATRVHGATWTPHCAALHPARLARGLAEAVERRGVRVHEQTCVRELRPGCVVTDHGVVRASYVVRATEAWTAALPGLRRRLAPVYSLMIATAPLPDDVWERIGLRDRETFSEHRHLVVYGQRTADGRIAFGGRGAPYHFGSRADPAFDREPTVFAALRRTLVDLFPVLADVPVTHCWGGPVGVPRDWFASVGLDRETGMGWAGGYVGDGVAASNLAGRTLADLVLGRDTERTRLPWVGHRSRSWEPEPLRWVGANAMLRVVASADGAELRTGRQARRAALAERLLGRR